MPRDTIIAAQIADQIQVAALAERVRQLERVVLLLEERKLLLAREVARMRSSLGRHDNGSE